MVAFYCSVAVVVWFCWCGGGNVIVVTSCGRVAWHQPQTKGQCVLCARQVYGWWRWKNAAWREPTSKGAACRAYVNRQRRIWRTFSRPRLTVGDRQELWDALPGTTRARRRGPGGTPRQSSPGLALEEHWGPLRFKVQPKTQCSNVPAAAAAQSPLAQALDGKFPLWVTGVWLELPPRPPICLLLLVSVVVRRPASNISSCFPPFIGLSASEASLQRKSKTFRRFPFLGRSERRH